MEISNKRILTLNEACEYTGYSKSYVLKLTANNIIPFSKPNGKSIFFDREKLEEWLLRNPKKTLQERQQLAATHISTSK